MLVSCNNVCGQEDSYGNIGIYLISIPSWSYMLLQVSSFTVFYGNDAGDRDCFCCNLDNLRGVSKKFGKWSYIWIFKI